MINYRLAAAGFQSPITLVKVRSPPLFLAAGFVAGEALPYPLGLVFTCKDCIISLLAAVSPSSPEPLWPVLDFVPESHRFLTALTLQRRPI